MRRRRRRPGRHCLRQPVRGPAWSRCPRARHSPEDRRRNTPTGHRCRSVRPPPAHRRPARRRFPLQPLRFHRPPARPRSGRRRRSRPAAGRYRHCRPGRRKRPARLPAAAWPGRHRRWRRRRHRPPARLHRGMRRRPVPRPGSRQRPGRRHRRPAHPARRPDRLLHRQPPAPASALRAACRPRPAGGQQARPAPEYAVRRPAGPSWSR